MRFLLILFLALASGIALTLLAENPGYILITREPWSIETSLTIFALGLVFAFVLVYFFVRLITYFVKAPANMRRWQNIRNRDQSIKDTRNGLAAAINGNWQSAEKLLSKRLEHSPQGEINLLASAWAAQQDNELQKRDDFIAAASNLDTSSDDIKTASRHIQLALQKQAGQTEQALATARSLYKESPASPAAIRSLVDLLKETKQWQELLSILAASSRHNVFTEKELLKLQTLAATEHLASADSQSDLKEYWKSLAKPTQKQADIITSYSRSLLRLNQHQAAETFIRSSLKQQWSDDLVGIYGQLKTDDPGSQLKHAESWLSEHPTNSQLMLCMSRLAIQNKLWGMARSFLEIGVQNDDSNEAYLELAWLLESLGETERALCVYRDGLEKSLSSGPKTYSVPASSQVEVYEGEGVIPDAVSVGKKKKDKDRDNQSPSLAYSNESK